jgi:Flp pilus assembly protein TadG
VRPGREDEGQAAVELALVLPLVALLLLVVVQVALVARDQVLVVHAAREGARAAAVDPSPGAARRAAVAGTPLKAGRLVVETSHHKGHAIVSVAVRYRSVTDLPLVGPLVPDPLLGANAAMRIERDIGREESPAGDRNPEGLAS